MRDATGVEEASGNSWQTASKVDVDIDLRVQDVAQDAILQDQQSKSWTNKMSIRNSLTRRT